MQNDKLLPCPFCGGEAIMHKVEPHTHILAKFMPDCKGESFIECTKCTCAMSGDTEEEVVNAWNTRKPMQLIIEKIEKEKDYYKKIYEGLPKGNVISERAQAVVETCEGCIEEIKRWCR